MRDSYGKVIRFSEIVQRIVTPAKYRNLKYVCVSAIFIRMMKQNITKLSVEWVNLLFKFGICKYEDGTYDFEKEDMLYTVMEVCENPILLKTLTW